MTQETAPDKSRTGRTPPGVSRVDEIDKRAQALRDNLKKRKAQSAKTSDNRQDKEDENED